MPCSVCFIIMCMPCSVCIVSWCIYICWCIYIFMPCSVCFRIIRKSHSALLVLSHFFKIFFKKFASWCYFSSWIIREVRTAPIQNIKILLKFINVSPQVWIKDSYLWKEIILKTLHIDFARGTSQLIFLCSFLLGIRLSYIYDIKFVHLFEPVMYVPFHLLIIWILNFFSKLECHCSGCDDWKIFLYFS